MSEPITFYVQDCPHEAANGVYEVDGLLYKRLDGPYAGQWAKPSIYYLVSHLCSQGGFLRLSLSEKGLGIHLCEENREEILNKLHFYDFVSGIDPTPWCSLDGIENSPVDEASISIWESIRPYVSDLEGFGLIEEDDVKRCIREACEMLEKKVRER